VAGDRWISSPEGVIDMATKQANVIDVLVEQHHQIKDMLLDVAEARGDEKEELFQDIVKVLAVHETAEEHIVHPMARPTVGDSMVDERLSEEEQIQHALVELYELGTTHAGFDRRVRELADAFGEHAGKEQTEEFAVLREKEDPAELRRMGDAVVAMEAKIMGERARLSEAGRVHGYYGPPVAVFNRAREALAEWQATQ
jgi:Hemerythrin HHE cation binding domain